MKAPNTTIISAAFALALTVAPVMAIPFQLDSNKPAPPANDSLVINEDGGVLIITLNGVAISGSPFSPNAGSEHWVETLSGYSFDKNVNGTFKLGEPEDTREKNEISSFNTNGHFEWKSDIA